MTAALEETEGEPSGKALVHEGRRIGDGADVNLWRYIPAQRRRRAWVRSSERRCCSRLLLRRKQIQMFGGRATPGSLRLFFHSNRYLASPGPRTAGVELCGWLSSQLSSAPPSSRRRSSSRRRRLKGRPSGWRKLRGRTGNQNDVHDRTE